METKPITEYFEPADQVTPTNTPQPESNDMELTTSEEKTADTPQTGGLTISTIPKAQLDTKPDFEFATLPVYVAPVYVDPTSYEFIISKKKRVDRTLDVYFIGVGDPVTGRPWAFTLATPRCMLTFSLSKFPSDEPESRALICPAYVDDQTTNMSSFLLFVQHLDGVSNALKERFRMMRCDVTDWLTPIKDNNGMLQGVQVKVKNPRLKEIIRGGASNVICCVKISCCYFASKRSGLSLELLDCAPFTP